MDKALTSLLEDPQLRPFLPLLWMAWSDGDLEPLEMMNLERRIDAMPWLRPAARQALARWLDPARLPSVAERNEVLAAIQRTAGTLAPERRKDLFDLGASLSGVGEGEEEAAVRKALVELGRALGISPGDGAALWSSDGKRPRPEPKPAATCDGKPLRAWLDGPHAAVRNQVREFIANPEIRAYGLPVPEYRAKVAGWLTELAKRGVGARAFPTVTFDGTDLGSFLAAFETLAFSDLSLLIRFGVQFGLFGGSIFFLGTDEQRRAYLPKAATMELPGCFAMSEVGHGSNVQGLETRAIWDQTKKHFVLSTPKESSRKDWIGGAAQFAKMATVFAQLEVGGESLGVHAFLVPLRNANGELLPGVRAGDSGHKMGLNGVDNGRLWFESVELPKDAMLGRFARITETGSYESPIENPKKRFFAMLGALVGGRVSIAASSVSVAKVALAIAVRYANKRRQFGPDGEAEVPLLSYPSHQRRLLTRLASTYVYHGAMEGLRARFSAATSQAETPIPIPAPSVPSTATPLPTPAPSGSRLPSSSSMRAAASAHGPSAVETAQRELEAAAAGLKAVVSWHATDTVQACREACGGQGFLSVNRLPDLRTDVDIFTTFEGDNTVLLQLAARGVLTAFRRRFQGSNLVGIARFLFSRASVAMTEKNPIIVRRTDREHLRDRGFHLSALRYREDRLAEVIATKLRQRLEEGVSMEDAMPEVQERLVALGEAHAQRLALQWFDESVRKCDDATTRQNLDALGALHALTVIDEAAAFYLEEGYLDTGKSRAMRDETTALLAELAPIAEDLVNAFGIPDGCLAAPIAFMDPANPRWD